MNSGEARVELIRVLKLDDDMSWDHIVYYTAKANSALRASNQTVQRRTEQLVAALGLPAGTTWTEALIRVRPA